MTEALVDTQALLFWLSDDRRLGKDARRLMARRPLSVSVCCLRDIAIKVQIGRLEADVAEAASAPSMRKALPVC